MAIPASSVLLIEDDPNDVLLMNRAVAKAGFAGPFQVAVDGEEAIATLSGAEPAPALVFLDLKLPRVSGLDVLAWVKAQPALRRIPVVILTSSREERDLARAYDLGANAYVLKPASFNDLVALLKRLFGFWLGDNTFAEVSGEEVQKARTQDPPKRRVSDKVKA